MGTRSSAAKTQRHGSGHKRFLLLVAFVGVIMSGACSAADDVLRAAARNADELARGRRFGVNIAAKLASLDEAAAARAANRVDNLSLRFQLPAETREAFNGLMWDVGCDIATGSIPRTTGGVGDWLASRAASFGLEFIDGGAQRVGEALLDAVGFDAERTDAAKACDRLPESGF